MELKEQIDIQRLPQHIAVIMDGNGRWAKERGKPRIFGHQSAIQAVRETIEASAELGIPYLTLYAFSTENWNRPTDEVGGLMALMKKVLRDEIKSLHENNIRVNVIGDFAKLPSSNQEELRQAMELTKGNTRLVANFALSYSGRWDLTQAARRMATDAAAGRLNPDEIGEATVGNYLSTAGMPDPELLIRTSGEQRISNFLLWELAYAELYFTPKYWPDFRKADLYEAILDYQRRERRFGKTSEQIK